MSQPEATTDYVADRSPAVETDPSSQQGQPSTPKLQKSHEGEHHGDFGDTDVPITHMVKVFALCAAINSCNLGYDIGTSSKLADAEVSLVWLNSLANFFLVALQRMRPR